jgi:general secretion pathway protein A
MVSRLRWIVALLVILTGSEVERGELSWAKDANSDAGVALQTVLELERTAQLLAILLDSGRSVINENQGLFDDPGKREKGLTPEAFERQLTDMFRGRSGIDLADLESARIPSSAKQWLRGLAVLSKQVVAEAQPEISRPPVGSKGFIPAVFGARVARVATRFTKETGVRMKQTALVPRNPANAPDPSERASLEIFADPNYPRERVISETSAKSKTLRLNAWPAMGSPKEVWTRPAIHEKD